MKFPKITKVVNTQIDSLITFNREIKEYSQDNPPAQSEDAKSDSTISSVDQNDLEILMSGDHHIYFDAFEMMKYFFEITDKNVKQEKN